METCVHLWSYLAEFFSEWEKIQTKVVEKIKTHILCSITFSRKSFRLWDNVEKYGRARQTTDDNITRRMRFACCITNATDTRSEYVIFTAFPWQQWLRERASMLTCIRTLLPALYFSVYVSPYFSTLFVTAETSITEGVTLVLRSTMPGCGAVAFCWFLSTQTWLSGPVFTWL
jgi:hypothetical protein